MAPKYRPGATDAEGRYYLTAAAGTVLGSRAYNTEGNSWGNPLVSGFKGAARDGYWYANGVLAEWGDFGSVAEGVRDKSWSTVDITEAMRGFPDQFYYGRAYPYDTNRNAVSIVGTNRARLSSPSQALYRTGNALTTAFRGCLVGDFDVEMSLHDLGGQSNWIPACVGLMVFSNQVSWFGQGAMKHSTWGTYQTYVWNDESGENGGGAAWTPTASAKLAITRVGNLFRAYYDAGSGGGRQLSGSRTAIQQLMHPNMYVGVIQSQLWDGPLGSASGANCAPYAEVGLTLNSGTFSNRPSWATKISTADRGSRADFPENVLLIWTAKELSLIDLDNETLWMRLKNKQAGSSLYCVLPGVAATSSIVDAWLDTDCGVLYAMIYDSATATSGVAIVADFSTDCVDCYHNSTTGFSVGDSMEIGYVPHYPWGQRTCQFDYPNGGAPGANHQLWVDGYSWRSYQTQGDQYRISSTWTDATYLYTAIATRTGLRVIKRQFSKTDAVGTYATWSGATDVRDVKFADDGTLWFTDATNVYRVDAATWGAAFGGSFAADATVVQPGTISVASQYKITPADYFSGIFVARDEGVYFLGNAGGAFSLYYGSVGSGATSEILPVYTKVTSFEFKTGVTTDHMVYAALTQAGPTYRVVGWGAITGQRFLDEDVTATMGAETIELSAGPVT
jgi:hypothetical protein